MQLNPVPPEELNYEQALAELEAILEALEGGQHPLEETLALFARGQEFSLRCAALLDQAELRIEQLESRGGNSGAA